MNNDTSRRLLVADDNEILRRLFSTVLTKAGYTVDTAVDGSEALELLMSSEYDIIITDINMPRLDGIGLYKAAVNYSPRVKDRFLFMTGRPTDDIRPHIDDIDKKCLSKPFPVSDLLSMVESLTRDAGTEEEKREDVRHDTLFECRILIETMEQKLLRARLQDFSQNGLRIACDEGMLQEGSIVKLCMNINYMTMVREARVVWTKSMEGEYLSVGLRLDEPISVSSIMGLMTVSVPQARISGEMHLGSM